MCLWMEEKNDQAVSELVLLVWSMLVLLKMMDRLALDFY